MANSLPAHRQALCPACGVNSIKSDRGKQCSECRYHPGWHTAPKEDTQAFEAGELPDELPTAEELLKRRSTQFAKKNTAIDDSHSHYHRWPDRDCPHGRSARR
jgi:hypothetical protein